jgi:DNA-binding CsgD family transcriptional regulator
LVGQHTPEIINYKITDYKAHHQNWSISQDTTGNMYFANTEGLLSFNGNAWDLHKIKPSKIVRSVCSAGDRLYTGAYGEIGYWKKGDCGVPLYYTLNDIIPDNVIDKEEIWQIKTFNNRIYFQSFSVLLVYDGITIRKINLPGNIMFLNDVKGRLYIQCLDFGIYEIINDNVIQQLAGTSFFKGKTVTGIVGFDGDDQLIIATAVHGIFTYKNSVIKEWNSAYNKFLSDIQINKIVISTKGQIILGSIRDGLWIFAKDGALLYRINTTNGLQNNTVLSIFEDSESNLWLGLDKGIVYIRMNENLLLFNDHPGALGTVYTALSDTSVLYLGTNQGLYIIDNKKYDVPAGRNNFRLVAGTQGQVWQLKKIKNSVLCGHNEGTFIVSGDKAKKISGITGGWYTDSLPGFDDILLQGTYTGLIIFKNKNGNVSFSHRISGFDEPVKKFIADDRFNIWVTGPNTGLSKIRLDDSAKSVVITKKYGLIDGLRNPANIDLNVLNGKIMAYDGDRHYFYESAKDKFEPDSILNGFVKGFIIRSIENKDWFRIYNDRIVVMKGYEPRAEMSLALNKDYHNIMKVDKNQYLFCLNNGYAWLNSENISSLANKNTIHIEKIVSVPTGNCYMPDKHLVPDIKYEDNSIQIHFHDFLFQREKSYYYRLKPLINEWRSVRDAASIEFSNLAPGNYTFEIKRNDNQNSNIDFIILHPWYQSDFAKFLYFIILLLGFYGLKKYFDRKLKIEKLKLEEENERLLREHKYQIENDRLVYENINKSKELANATMHLIQKNELLQEIKEELIDVRKTGDHTLTAKDFQNLMKLINTNMSVEDDKNLFESSFNEVHNDFLKRIKNDFPDLSPADLKLAAYLKMNLSSKEIAPLFNISIRGLENKRYRLRKKLNLTNDANLTEFFINYY